MWTGFAEPVHVLGRAIHHRAPVTHTVSRVASYEVGEGRYDGRDFFKKHIQYLEDLLRHGDHHIE